MIESKALVPERAETLTGAAPIVEEAYRLAAREHAGQNRKATPMPYLDHVLAVADLLSEHAFDDEVVAAALLHDAVEHTDLSAERIASQFGERVAGLVAAMTDRDQIEDWEQRKDEHRERVRGAGRDAVAIYAADKLAGVREARVGYAEVDESVEGRLGTPLDLRLRVWERDLELVSAQQPPLPLAPELAEELRRLRQDRATSSPRS
jgi:guanosine-3',5'-bis(diphosphate) 3'-pyrophosphohydrolase